MKTVLCARAHTAQVFFMPPFFALAITALAILAASCATAGSARPARDTVPWAGTYTGMIPAASGPGINVRIILNEDMTCDVSYRYIDHPEANFDRVVTFNWDETGNIIVISGIAGFPSYYRAGYGTLTQLDTTGNPVTGGLAGHYILRRQTGE